MVPSVDELGDTAALSPSITRANCCALGGGTRGSIWKILFLRLIPGAGTRHGYGFQSKDNAQDGASLTVTEEDQLIETAH